jgi:AcrR family transcriptional regulator
VPVDEPKSLSRRDREMAARREDIKAAAMRVFAEKGFERATIREIAEAADVGEGTIYNHFESKVDLLISMINEADDDDDRRADYAAGLQQSLHDFFQGFLQARLRRAGPSFGLLLSLMPEVMVHEELRQHLLQEHMLPEMAEMTAHAEQRIARKLMRPVDVPAAVRILESAILGLSMLQAVGDPVALELIADPDRLVAAMTAMFVDGLAPDGGDKPAAVAQAGA